MPISRASFYNKSWKNKKKLSKNSVLDFLKKHPNNAYKVKEIAKLIKRSESLVRHNLKIIIKRGLVVKDTPFYIIKQTNKKRKSK